MTESAILRAAERLFLDRGYGDTRVEDVAEVADVAVGSIYRHFGSKLGLYLAIVDHALAEQEDAFAAVHATGAPPRERLTALAEAYVDFALTSPARFQLLADAAHVARDASDPAAVELGRDLVARGARLVADLAELLAEGIERGQLRPVDPQRAARFLWASWSGVLGLHLRRDHLGAPTGADVRAIVAAGTDIVRHGIATAEPSTP